ncbi:MotA/TolQ/ExbB proton channel family protein [Candidatus Babeliales bacterium]|nr:MotA/TolQ/ExbB proton channel family protein [Candidatus Babeliales bacterium]MBP9844322.1 MotA/TolQ/ExbB proton channel family protein [Candidatus Babeliales bacterium]
MAAFLGASTMWSLVLQGDAMTKFILIFLFGMSILSWTIALYKLVLFRIKLFQLQQISLALKDVDDFKNLFAVMQQHMKTLPGYFLSRSLKYLKELLVIARSGKQEYAQTTGLDFLQMQIGQLTDEIVHQEESHILILTVSAAVGPLIGLLGTVWGLVHSFIDISQKQSADIVTVAPGIAEALITTIAGLLVAIPAVMLFYYVSSKVRDIEYQLYLLADKVVLVARNLVVDKDLSATSMIQETSFDQEVI